ncbi:MAG: type I secretion system permease/ATPase [Hyphomicrobiales bacterium]|nr:type I secretion system permease/ATPase [Hyphomicrobiales bacterium]
MNSTPSHGAQPNILKEVVGACRRAFVTVGAFSFFINVLVLTVPLYMVQVFDRVMTSHSTDTLLVLTVAAIAALTVMAMLDLVRSRMLVRVGVWLDDRLGPRVFGAALGKGRRGAGQASQGIRDLGQVRGFLTGAGIFAVLDAPWVPLFVALIFILHPTLGLVAMLGGGALFGLAFLNDRLTRTPLDAAGAAAQRNLAAAEVMGRQADAIEGLGMVPALTKWWAERNRQALDLQAQASDRAGLIVAASKLTRLALQILMLGLAALFVVRGELTVGAMIAASIILTRALAPVEQSIGVWRSLQSARASFARIKEDLARDGAQAEAVTVPRPKGHLLVEKAVFAPGGPDAPVFADVSFDVQAGQILGITGPSGAGKSSLARMLVGVDRPAKGTVRLDGLDVFAWKAEDLGRHVGFVPQVVELLPGTVRDNIARFTDAAPEAVFKAAEAAGIHDAILKLPQGYDTPVGGPSDILSVGMRQRVALARALFGEPQLLIMDEPYSNLDADGMTAFITVIESLRARGATVVVVAHRPSVLARTDRVLLLQNGQARVVEKRKQARLKLAHGPDGELPEDGGEDDAETDATVAKIQPTLMTRQSEV